MEDVRTTVSWNGPLSIGSQVTLTYQITLPTSPVHPPPYNVAFLEDGIGGAWERSTWIILEPRQIYLPLMYRSFSGLRHYMPLISKESAPHSTPRASSPTGRTPTGQRPGD